MKRGARFAVVGGVALSLALAPLTPLAPFVPATPLTQLAHVSPAAAEEACTPGAMARIPGPPPVLEAMAAEPGSLAFTGDGILVAVVDSGVDSTRPQLGSALVSGSTSLVSDGERPDGLGDPYGHGTAVAGIIAARSETGSGVVGVAPDADLISIRVFASAEEQGGNNEHGPNADRLARGISEAVKRGAKIIVVAMSDDVDSPSLRRASAEAADAGALIVASAGNRATAENTADGPRYPAAYPGVLSVTAVTLSGLPTDDSIHGSHIDVAAPGQEVLTTATGAGDCMYAADAPSSSFSTAYVAGVAALLAEAYPEEGPEGWVYRLKATADRPNPDDRDDLIGWGRIRPEAALDLRPDRSTRGPESPFADTSKSAVKQTPTTIARSQTEAQDPTVTITIGVVLGGLVIIVALGAHLRRQRKARAVAEVDERAAAERQRQEEAFHDPESPEAIAEQDARDYPGLMS